MTSETKLSGNSFGEAGRQIVIEEGLCGPELSSSRCVMERSGANSDSGSRP